MAEIGTVLGEIAGTLVAIKDTVGNIIDGVKEFFVQGGTEVIGLSDAISEPVEISKEFLGSIFPTEFVIMVGIGFTVIVTLAMRRSTNA